MVQFAHTLYKHSLVCFKPQSDSVWCLIRWKCYRSVAVLLRCCVAVSPPGRGKTESNKYHSGSILFVKAPRKLRKFQCPQGLPPRLYKQEEVEGEQLFRGASHKLCMEAQGQSYWEWSPRYLPLNWPWFCKDPFMYTPIKALNTAHWFTKSALDEIFSFYFWWGGCLDSLLSG